MIPTSFITALVVFVFIAMCFYGFAAGNILFVSLVVFSPAAIFLIQRPDVWMAILFALWSSSLKIPQAPASLTVYHLMSMVMLAFLVFYRILTPGALRRSTPIRKYVFLFLVTIILTGVYRGFGLRMFGSRLWGGAPYIILTLACLLFLSADVIVLRTRLWRNALVAMCLLSFLPSLAQLVYVLSGGAIVKQYAFIQPIGFVTETLEAVTSQEGVPRFSTNASVTLVYLPLILLAAPFKYPRVYGTGLLVAIAIALADISGSRYSVIMIITYLGFYLALAGRRVRIMPAAFATLGIAAFLGITALFGRHLPLPIQRTLSFIPWADISWDARADAVATTVWRMDVWRRAFHEDLHRFWLIGRGFAFDPRDFDAVRTLGLEARDWAFITGSYHNGPLSLILNLGIAGLIFGLAFFGSTVLEHMRLMRSDDWPDPLLQRMHKVVLIMFINQSFLYLTLGGDVQNFFHIFLYQATLLEGLARTRLALEQENLAREIELASPAGDEPLSPRLL